MIDYDVIAGLRRLALLGQRLCYTVEQREVCFLHDSDFVTVDLLAGRMLLTSNAQADR